jgi:aryl-alcohol dehydrogenase-like predicted oxidoreductase
LNGTHALPLGKSPLQVSELCLGTIVLAGREPARSGWIAKAR